MSDNDKNKFIPLSVPNISGNEWTYVKKCLDTGWVSSVGPFVNEFEKKICEYIGTKRAVACINGTSGIQISLKVAGVGNNDEVIVPVLTFIAPVNAVKYLNAEPVFMDCDDYLNIDTEKLEKFCKTQCRMSSEGLINKNSGRILKAVLPVHIFGNPCNMEHLLEIAEKYNLKIIEDATESLGSYYTSGKLENQYTGGIGDIGVFSFNGNKIITTGGGGMVVTDNEEYADKIRYLTTQAKDDENKFVHNEIGYNFRLTNVLSAIGAAQMELLEKFIEKKKYNYELYKNRLNDINGIKFIDPPAGTRPNYWFYSIIIEKGIYAYNNIELMNIFSENNIQTRPLWYL
ncbi:LegC family aminotransferase, partial [Candidatus Dependentiae bacterium]|nr:LegC family aminotransferase [Candidatus Dependentiae bacterium]